MDFVFGPDNIGKLPEMVARAGRERFAETGWMDSHDYVFPQADPEAARGRATAFVTAMKGCDNVCAFCIVPHTRGREVSRAFPEIVAECAALAEVGVREVTLIGQNVNSYAGGCTFAELLRRVAAVPGIVRIRFTTSHPHDLSDALVEAFRDEPKVMPHFHLPVQSGSDPVLVRMRRDYTVAEYLERFDRCAPRVPASRSPRTSSSASPARPTRTSRGRSRSSSARGSSRASASCSVRGRRRSRAFGSAPRRSGRRSRATWRWSGSSGSRRRSGASPPRRSPRSWERWSTSSSRVPRTSHTSSSAAPPRIASSTSPRTRQPRRLVRSSACASRARRQLALGNARVSARARTALLVVGAVAWAALIFWVSSTANPFPEVPRRLLEQDKLLHAAAYAVLGALVRGALGGARLRPWMALGLAVAVGTAYGASDEWHQSFVPNRSSDPADLAADAIGAAMGAALASLILRRVGARATIRA